MPMQEEQQTAMWCHPFFVQGLALAAALACASGNAATPEGLLLVRPSSISSEGDGSLVDLHSGRTRMLPRSAVAQRTSGYEDTWFVNSASTSNGTLVRVDGRQRIEFFDRSGSTRTGGFSVNDLSGVNQPQLWGPVKPSPDGRYVLAYWKKDYRQEQPKLTVFDQTGRVVESGSKYRYDAQGHNEAFDWLPDGRYIYLAGNKIELTTIGDANLRVAILALPSNVSTRGTLVASPDGRRLLMTLPTTLKDKAGVDTQFGLLYTSNLDGTMLRQLTMPSARAQATGGKVLHRRSTWSPTGEYVAFAIDAGRAYSVAGFGNGCPPVTVVPSNGERIPIDGLSDPDSYHLLIQDTKSRTRVPLKACWTAARLTWLKSE